MDKIATDVVKIGIVVNNIEEAARRYAELFNIEPPAIRIPDPNAPVNPAAYKLYKGERRQTRIKTAVIKLKPIFIELIEPIDENSPWSDFRDEHGQGVQFVAFHVEGFDEHLALMERKGMPSFFREEKGKERYAYFETESALGITLEFKEIDRS
jgi:methylmalonyl-CoA/ethylmalonyl-CoA epimerase